MGHALIEPCSLGHEHAQQSSACCDTHYMKVDMRCLTVKIYEAS